MFSVAACAVSTGARALFIAFFGVWIGLQASAQTVPIMNGVTDGLPPGAWQVAGLPNIKKPMTRFDAMTLDTKKVLRVRTDKSYGNLSYTFAPAVTAGTLAWRWRLDQPLADADLRRKGSDDAPIKVCALFDLPLDRLHFVERNLLRMARSASGQHLPGATLCYVWDQKLAVDTELPNAFTRRVRYIVLNSATTPLQIWVSHRRDLSADFLRSFGTESSTVPPLMAIVVGADSDNTGGASLAYLDDLVLTKP